MTTDIGDDLGKPIRYTIVVRRGLALIREAMLALGDERRPPFETWIQGLSAKQAREWNTALMWIEQETSERKGTP